MKWGLLIRFLHFHGLTWLAASQLQMMKNHLNLPWWKAPYSVSGCSCASPGRVKGSPHWYTWACNLPAGGMAALPHPLGFFLSSPIPSLVSSWGEPFRDLYYIAMPPGRKCCQQLLALGDWENAKAFFRFFSAYLLSSLFLSSLLPSLPSFPFSLSFLPKSY